jgi:hypothetical protein
VNAILLAGLLTATSLAAPQAPEPFAKMLAALPDYPGLGLKAVKMTATWNSGYIFSMGEGKPPLQLKGTRYAMTVTAPDSYMPRRPNVSAVLQSRLKADPESIEGAQNLAAAQLQQLFINSLGTLEAYLKKPGVKVRSLQGGRRAVVAAPPEAEGDHHRLELSLSKDGGVLQARETGGRFAVVPMEERYTWLGGFCLPAGVSMNETAESTRQSSRATWMLIDGIPVVKAIRATVASDTRPGEDDVIELSFDGFTVEKAGR